MGAKQSKRSVDITSSPSKAADGEAIAEGEGRVVKIGDVDVKAATNGTVPHTEKELEAVGDKDENAKDLTVEKSTENEENKEKDKEEIKENGVSDTEELKTPDSNSTADNLNESAAEKTLESAAEGKEVEGTPETNKQKEKKKKKWSFRSISFSKKDKSKPNKEAAKNGEVKEVAEENAEDAKSPTSESPKVETPSEPAAEAAPAAEAPALNGDASKEEIVETPKETEAAAAAPAVEEKPKLEESKPIESSVEKKIEELKVTETEKSPEETKEVRNEEVPPPLPSSNPPSSLTAFAETTKADTIDLIQASTDINTSPIISSANKEDLDVKKSEPIPPESPKKQEIPLVQEIISIASSETSNSSVPLVTEEIETKNIELKLEPLPPIEAAEIKDLSSKTDVEIKKTPENISLVNQEETITSQESFISNLNQECKSSDEKIEDAMQLKPIELVIEDAKPKPVEVEQPSEQSINSEESESVDLPPPESENKSPVPPVLPVDDLPSPTDLPKSTLGDTADSLQDISTTESLPSMPEPVSEILAEPMSLPPVESLPEPIATDACETKSELLPESIAADVCENKPELLSEPIAADVCENKPELSEPIAADVCENKPELLSEPIATDVCETKSELPPSDTINNEIIDDNSSIPADSDPTLPPTECPPVLTNGNVNGLVSPDEVTPTMNGGSIVLAEAAPIKQVLQEISKEDIGKEEGDKAGTTTSEVASVEE